MNTPTMTTGLYKEEKKINQEYSLKDYQQDASRTFLSKGDLEKDILHCLVGMQTELGELADPFKKQIYYGKSIDMVNVSEEIADTMWYLVNLARLTNVDLLKSLTNNIEKLKVRFPEKFTSDNAINRNIDAERKQLEK